MIVTSIIVGVVLALVFGPSAFGIGVVGTMVVIAVCKIVGDIFSKGSSKQEEKESIYDKWDEFDWWQDNQGL